MAVSHRGSAVLSNASTLCEKNSADARWRVESSAVTLLLLLLGWGLGGDVGEAGLYFDAVAGDFDF